MSCGCDCNNCGDTPKVSGTEVTLLSGTKPSTARHNGEGSKTGTYVVAASAAAIAAVAFFVTRK
jgi:hypothetical protein